MREAGYVGTKKDGSERLNFTAFYVTEGVLIWVVEPRLTREELLAAYAPMDGEPTEAMA